MQVINIRRFSLVLFKHHSIIHRFLFGLLDPWIWRQFFPSKSWVIYCTVTRRTQIDRSPQQQRLEELKHPQILINTFIFLLIRVATLWSSCTRARSELGGTRWRTGGEVKGKLANGVGSQYSHATSERGLSSILKLMRTPRLPAVDWTDAPTDLNGLIRFGERRNVVSALVPSRSARAIPQNDRRTVSLIWQV